jgi:hypothetical protein
MPNTTVRAAAEGMPAINRRRILIGLAAASTAAAVTTAPAAHAALAATPAENPELLRLEGEFAQAFSDLNDAKAGRLAAIARYRSPHVPNVLVQTGPIGAGLTDPETDCVGTRWVSARRLYSSYEIKRIHPNAISGRAYKHGGYPQPKYCREMRARYSAAVQYEKAKEAAIDACGIDAAEAVLKLANGRIRDVLFLIRKEPAKTTQGIAAKAGIVAACDRDSGLDCFANAAVSPGLVADILAVLGGDA